MKRLKKLAISVGCRFFIAMCLCMFAGVDIIYAQHADSDSITGKVHQIPDVTASSKELSRVNSMLVRFQSEI